MANLRSEPGNELIDLFNELIEAGLVSADLTPIVEQVVQVVQLAYSDRIIADDYAELADATKKQRVRDGYAEGPPLIRSGDLLRYIENNLKGEVNSSNGIEIFGDDTANDDGVLFSLIANVMDKGSTTRNIPARPIFELSEAANDLIAELVADNTKEIFSRTK